ncbi:hypothetical protein CBL_12786 [Carabus blaptoides fortunei]
MSSIEEVLDLSQTDADTFRCSTDSETDIFHEQTSRDLSSSDKDLPIPCTFNHRVTSYSSTNAEKNNNSVNPIFLTLARRKMLSKLAPTRQSLPDITLYEDVIQTRNDQMFTVCTMTSFNQSKSSSSAVGSFKLTNMASTMENLGHPRSHHSGQNQMKTEQDLSVTEQKMSTGLAALDFHPAPSLYVGAGVNTKLETTDPVDVECLAILTYLRNVASVPPGSVQSRGPEKLLDAQLTLKPTSPETVNTDAIDTDEHLEFAVQTILDNDCRSFLVNNIDIYRNIHRCQLGKYHLNDVPFQHVIVTGVIISKSGTRKSITQLEVDDGTAVVNCLFEDLQCLPELRNNFHKHLDCWKHSMPVFKTDAVFDETFHFLSEYAKRLFQETPQSDDLNLGDEVTIIGKVYDSKNEGRVIYHKYLWRKVDLVSRENCGYVQNQFAKHGRYF